ncbi:hypothetical protein BC939DRAFT_471960 [Gamsiella multidivaricata]|uniref:uncharacterized protein n=1 Tax=Gamsiella multidivaricata TaxID=101098 RepID=UPI00221FD11C|nr:uncharacterized protein BC939DRAFT_471960 [Gamsiella multidivaricata]KAI7815738.1 hypothetical protein BC939DRAFT_471960 [Gamsiella multidivaricata]
MSTSTNINLPAENSTPPLSPPPSDDHRAGNDNTFPIEAEAPETLSDVGATTKATGKAPSRFDFHTESVLELVLLRALVVKTWGKVVDYLHESDRVVRPTKPFFTNAYLEAATGIAPEETERRQLMEELYRLKLANNEATVEARQDRTRQQENAVEERRLGQLLLDAAESAELRLRIVSDSDSAAPPTRYSKKRITIQQIEKQQQEAIAQVKEQRELMAQQVALQKEDMEHRKMHAQRQEEKEAARDVRQEQRELDKEERYATRKEEKGTRRLEWEREKQRQEDIRDRERLSRQDDLDERRHKEALEVFKQQSTSCPSDYEHAAKA